MTTELLTVDVPDSLRTLWQRRWALIASVAVGAFVAFLGASLLPQTWESQAVVELGHVGEKSIESGAALVRKVNLGTLPCGDRGQSDVLRTDGITARLDPVNEFIEVRLVGVGRSADEAVSRTTRAVECLSKRHDGLFAAAQRRDAARRDVLQLQLSSLKDNIDSLTTSLGRVAAAGSTADTLLLQDRIDALRVRERELSDQLLDFDAAHSGDTSTVALSPPSRPAAPVWPRRGLMAVIAGALALVTACAALLFARSTAPRLGVR
jgi:uncharacterized protein involved in exopolysaccharide biosynthesis